MKSSTVQVKIDKALKDENSKLKATIASWKNIIEPMIKNGNYDGTILHVRLVNDLSSGDYLLNELNELREENNYLKDVLSNCPLCNTNQKLKPTTIEWLKRMANNQGHKNESEYLNSLAANFLLTAGMKY